MKKLIIIFFAFCLVPFALQTQTIDTATWSLKAIGTDGTYRLLENRATYLGKAAGTVIVPIQFSVNSIDTALWGFKPIGSDGSYRLVYNKETYLGKDSGTVVAQLVYSTGNSVGTATIANDSAVVNTMHGVITSTGLAGQTEKTYTIVNSFIQTTSIIHITVQFNGADISAASPIAHGLAEVNSGSMLYEFGCTAPFNDEVKIHFTIINP